MGTSGLANILVDDGKISVLDRATIRKTSGNCAGAFAKGILALGVLDEEELANTLAKATGLRRATEEELTDADPSAWTSLDRKLMGRLEALPLKLKGRSLFVALVDPLDKATLRQLEFFTGFKIKPVIATLSEIRRSLDQLLTDFKAVESPLENFLTNHASAAALRKNLDDSTKSRRSKNEHFGDTDEEMPEAAAASTTETSADGDQLDLSSLQKIDGDAPAPSDDFSELELEEDATAAPTEGQEGPPTTADEIPMDASMEAPAEDAIAPDMATAPAEDTMELTEPAVDAGAIEAVATDPLVNADTPPAEATAPEIELVPEATPADSTISASGHATPQEEDPFASLDSTIANLAMEVAATEAAPLVDLVAAENSAAADTGIDQIDAVDTTQITAESELLNSDLAADSAATPSASSVEAPSSGSAPLQIALLSAPMQSLNIAKLNQAVLKLTLANNEADATKVLINAVADVFVDGVVLKLKDGSLSGIVSWNVDASQKAKLDFANNAKYCTDSMKSYLKSLPPEAWQMSADITPPFNEWQTDKLWVSSLPTQSDQALCFILKVKAGLTPDAAYLSALTDLAKGWHF